MSFFFFFLFRLLYLLADFFSTIFAVNSMGHFSNLMHGPKPGPSREAGSTQNEQPQAVTAQPVAVPHPFAVVTSSPIAAN